MSLRDAISSVGIKTGDYTVTRTAVGSYNGSGIYVPGATSTFTISASIQPTSGRDLLALPEGQRTQENRTVYTETELKTRTPTTDPDKISIDGETWEVKTATRHYGHGGVHTVAIIARQANT